MNTQHAPSIPTYISRRALIERTGLSDTTIWRLVRRGDLPKPVRLSPGRVGWTEEVIRAWLDQRAQAGSPEAAGR